MAEGIKPASGIPPQGSTASGPGDRSRKEPAASVASAESAPGSRHGPGEDTLSLRMAGRKSEELEMIGLFNVLEKNNIKFMEAMEQEKKSGDTCVIPMLLGMTVGEAASKLKAAGLKVSRVTRQLSAQPQGQVVSQIPGAGERLHGGSGVHIIISG